ncbi:hypothetical protein [Fictibacillus halophilus]|uniref:hypothetical protein n=1 Tax=Fictibacillus halophilus TaxID=1610490 RepID=UPI001CFA0745|nr:hypothetical protein [Fictibacillus halophilus]
MRLAWLVGLVDCECGWVGIRLGIDQSKKEWGFLTRAVIDNIVGISELVGECLF